MVLLLEQGAEADCVAVEDVGHGWLFQLLAACGAERGAWTQPVQHRQCVAAARPYNVS
jgi:hypothetical protein